jgi:hypothetical protein
MNPCYSSRSHRLARLFSFGLLDGPQVRLYRPQLREAAAGFGLSRLATVFMNNPGWHSGFDLADADCRRWMKETGFKRRKARRWSRRVDGGGHQVKHRLVDVALIM